MSQAMLYLTCNCTHAGLHIFSSPNPQDKPLQWVLIFLVCVDQETEAQGGK